jgi:phenylpyruvate tautomerase PptA (4-oxalocrotonate tautomerase family)
MPLVRSSIPSGWSPEEKQALAQAIHQGMMEALSIPEHDFFQLIHEHHSHEIYYDPKYLGITRSNRFLVIEIILRRGRSDVMKKNLFQSITAHIQERLSLPTEDIMIVLVENDFSDWSLGKGLPGFQLSLSHHPS